MSRMKTKMLTDRELGDFCHNLAVLLHAGVGTADSLFLMAEEESGQKQKLFTELGQQLDRGGILSEVLAENGAFPKQICGMLRIGERTGQVEESLEYLTDFYEQSCRTRKLLRSSLAYPSLILMLVLVVVAVLLMEVLPVFDSVYASLGSRLTGLAAGLLHFGQALKSALPVLWGLLAAIAVGIVLIRCVPAMKAGADQWFQSHLADRGVLRKFNNARFGRALAMGLGSGLSLEEAVTLAGELLSDVPQAAKRCHQCVGLLQEGKSLPEAMETTRLLSASACRMLTMGVRGGNADQVMAGIAERMEEEAAEGMKQLVSGIEPAMVLVTSGLVGVILLSVMLPLMNIMSAIG